MVGIVETALETRPTEHRKARNSKRRRRGCVPRPAHEAIGSARTVLSVVLNRGFGGELLAA